MNSINYVTEEVVSYNNQHENLNFNLAPKSFNLNLNSSETEMDYSGIGPNPGSSSVIQVPLCRFHFEQIERIFEDAVDMAFLGFKRGDRKRTREVNAVFNMLFEAALKHDYSYTAIDWKTSRVVAACFGVQYSNINKKRLEINKDQYEKTMVASNRVLALSFRTTMIDGNSIERKLVKQVSEAATRKTGSQCILIPLETILMGCMDQQMEPKEKGNF